MDWSQKDIKINGRFLNNLRITDDIIFVSCEADEFRHLPVELMEKSKDVGLEMNLQQRL